MQRLILLLVFGSLFWLGSCSDCTTCTPFTEEPYVKVKFLHLADSSQRVIVIDSVNGSYSKEFRHFQDTTADFRFPLDMHNDSSAFRLVYRDTSALDNYLVNTVTLYYTREFFRRDDNYLVIRCDLNNLATDFTADKLSCNDSIICISNEATVRIYN